MKIALILRDPDKGGHSIEMLFELLGEALRSHAEVVELHWRGWRHLRAFLRELRAARADVHHITGDVNFLSLLLPRGCTVLTIHDIDHYRKTLSGWRKWVYRWLWFDLPLLCVDSIVTVSDKTAVLIESDLGIPNSRIRIIPNFISPAFAPSPKAEIGTPPVVLQIGTGPQKNLPRLFQALSGLRTRLVLVGRMTPDQQANLEASGVDCTNLINLSMDEVIAQYRAADIVAFASLYEGFGLPIVEAQTIGRPVITSNRPPMSDVAGDGALLIDPEDTQAYREALVSLMEDATLRAELVARGAENARKFSLESSVQAHLVLYRQLISGQTKTEVPR